MKNIIFNRRSFLKAALVGTMLIAARPAFSRELEDKAALLEDDGLFERVFDEEKPVIEKPSIAVKDSRLVMFNARTQERLDVEYRHSDGGYDEQALKAMNHFFRCHYADEEMDMDVRVIEYLNAIDKTLGGDNLINVISGYRSRKYNEMLRRRNRRVATHSYHLTGQAIDLTIPGIPAKKIKRAALQMKYGGVGYYPRAGFVHIDCGSFRRW
ncbi:MAG: DUF882 domain-containing protein [Deltaproteobacteria bacterium]|nr:DUF882 domain-containing protein [Deltaproteobacteria bacterium]